MRSPARSLAPVEPVPRNGSAARKAPWTWPGITLVFGLALASAAPLAAAPLAPQRPNSRNSSKKRVAWL